ncbi:INO80 complex subunit C [Thrips palmi]|uniref:INO80 complex subunit C n=1 Tax=Thrips palmi TaxID=161013 RepID=A0A6P9A9N1_THRPL|nr:INO80 complex subunit C [Thrips palmi]XP_034254752.1 INO80 complex subunit C [Thrips palmi]
MVSKKKRPNTPVIEVESIGQINTSISEEPSPSPATTEFNDEAREERKFLFKDAAYQMRANKSGNKRKGGKSLKQILTQERTLPWPASSVLYSSINAPPSFVPCKKYSDISGLQANYTDPQTKLFYASAEEFGTIRRLPSDIVAGYLALRRANNPIS